MQRSAYFEAVINDRLNAGINAGDPLAKQLRGHGAEIADELAAMDQFHQEPDGRWAISELNWGSWMTGHAAAFLAARQAPPSAPPRTGVRGFLDRLRSHRRGN
ncbi:hypothetical protein HP467_15875 [Curtobacterium albidum]|uniref:Uncharacterized protein n=1 Tax=Curtobacterium citreum TaxID=2036 RepID=A0A850DZE0_9MICO|nr:hypothetical protein [Curtobacterium albidum]NUU29570.1 hypothetical protein [Curtobacterium albidum]